MMMNNNYYCSLLIIFHYPLLTGIRTMSLFQMSTFAVNDLAHSQSSLLGIG